MSGATGKRESPVLLVIGDLRRRVVAGVIDAVLVFFLLMVLALLLAPAYYASGPYGRLISFGIAVTYFTIFSSGYGRGQTPGKRCTGIAVRNAQGKYLTLDQALVRSLVLCAIFLFNRWNIPIIVTSPVLTILANSIVLGGIATILYSYVVDADTRQTPYDMLAGSYVVLKPYPFEPLADYYVPDHLSHHVRALLGLLIVSLIVSVLLTTAFMDNNLLALEKTLNEDSTFFSVQASLDEDQLVLLAWYDERVDEDQCSGLARQLILDAYDSYDDRDAISYIKVTVFREIDLMVNDLSDDMCTEGWSR